MTKKQALDIIITLRESLDTPETINRDEIIGALNMAVNALMETRPQGKWREGVEPFGNYDEIPVAVCSECYESYILGELSIKDVQNDFKFCPNCGASMQK